MRFIGKLAPLALMAVFVAGCDLVQGIFKAGFIIGLIIAVIVVALLFKAFGGKGKE